MQVEVVWQSGWPTLQLQLYISKSDATSPARSVSRWLRHFQPRLASHMQTRPSVDLIFALFHVPGMYHYAIIMVAGDIMRAD